MAFEVVKFTTAFGDKAIAVRGKLPVLANGTDTKAILKQARGERSEYFAWDATTKAYTARYDTGLMDLCHALVAAIGEHEATQAPLADPGKPSKSNIADLVQGLR